MSEEPKEKNAKPAHRKRKGKKDSPEKTQYRISRFNDSPDEPGHGENGLCPMPKITFKAHDSPVELGWVAVQLLAERLGTLSLRPLESSNRCLVAGQQPLKERDGGDWVGSCKEPDLEVPDAMSIFIPFHSQPHGFTRLQGDWES
ncbi:hypothetical protein MJT46_019000 [Ovis ammon polii x Ovis aries]|nr:hypothetical protein MJT46_019000 [Ovis ammon polii x Ovis aries]